METGKEKSMGFRAWIWAAAIAGLPLLAGCAGEPRRDDGDRGDAVPAFRPAEGGGDPPPAHGPAAFRRRDDRDALRRPPRVGGGDARQPERPAGRADRGSRAAPPLPREGRRRDGDVPGAPAGGFGPMGEGGAHGARVPEGVEVVRDVGVRLRRLPGPAPLREGEPDRRDRPESAEGVAGGGPPDGARQRTGGPAPESSRRSARPIRGSGPSCAAFSRGMRGTAAGTNRSTPSSASSCSGRRRWRGRWSTT